MKQVISKDGTKIAYDENGNGRLVILVGGAMIERNFGPFRELESQLAKNFKVINYDRRGRGESGNTLPYAPRREIEDLNALIDAYQNPYVFGISSGAALVIHTVASGAKVAGIALYEPPFVMSADSDPDLPAKYASDLEGLIRLGRRAEVVKSFMKHVGVPAVIRWIMPLMSFWKSAIQLAHTIPYDLRILGDQKVPVALATQIKVPTLVMNGELSSPALRKAALDTANAIRGGDGHATETVEYRQLKGQRHDVAPTILAQELTRFFSRE